MSDVDESFIYGKDGIYNKDGLRQTAETIHHLQTNSPQAFYVWWNTVRVLDSIKKIAENTSLKSILNQFRLDGLIVNNGKQMFVNRSDKKAADWILSIDENTTGHNGQADTWRQEVEEKRGWKQENVDRIIKQGLSESGFQFKVEVTDDNFLTTPSALPDDDLRPSYRIWQNTNQLDYLIYYSPKHNTLRLTKWKQKSWNADNEELRPIVENILSKFQQAKIQFELPEIQSKAAHDKLSKNTLSIARLAPKDVNKATTTQFALNHYIDPVEDIIVVGDDKPDHILLTTDYKQHSNKLKKAAILCNQPKREPNDSPLKELFSDKRLNAIQSESGNIGAALQGAIEQLSS